MKTEEKIATTFRAARIPQAVLARFADVTTFSLSLWLRGMVDLPAPARDRVLRTADAIIAVADESPVPISWREPMRLKHLVDQKIEELRKAEDRKCAVS